MRLPEMASLAFANPAAETAFCVVWYLEFDVVSLAPGVQLVLEDGFTSPG